MIESRILQADDINTVLLGLAFKFALFPGESKVLTLKVLTFKGQHAIRVGIRYDSAIGL